MEISIHRQYVTAGYTVSLLSYDGATLQLLEPPVHPLWQRSIRAMDAGLTQLYYKRVEDRRLPVFRRNGRPYRFFITPVPRLLHVEEASFRCPFSDAGLMNPLYAGRYDDEGHLHPDADSWNQFLCRLTEADRRHEKIKVTITS